MQEVKSLERLLKKHIIMNAARINFTACFIIALLKTGTVNLSKIALAFPGRTNKNSKYKRIQRFFAEFPLNLDIVAKLIAEIIPQKIAPFVFSMDRTNWKLGKININILTVGIAYMGIAFPIIWLALDKRGNTNTNERIAITKRLIRLFGIEKILCLVADREFIGQAWFEFLIETGILFRIRIKENMLISNSQGILVSAKNIFRHLKGGTYEIIEGRRMILGHMLYIIGSRLPTGEYMIIVTNHDPEGALQHYKMRWGIETLFGCLKTRGFNFESTHLTELERIEKLVALLAIAFVWCYILGEWKNAQKEIQIKKHGRKAISIFRYGYDHIREILFQGTSRQFDFQRAVLLLFKNIESSFVVINNRNFLSCT
jgi:hypothetical protein